MSLYDVEYISMVNQDRGLYDKLSTAVQRYLLYQKQADHVRIHTNEDLFGDLFGHATDCHSSGWSSRQGVRVTENEKKVLGIMTCE
jgi:hypothetical protein